MSAGTAGTTLQSQEAVVCEELLSQVLQDCERSRAAAGLHLIYHYRAVSRYRQGKHSAAIQDAKTALAISSRFTPASCCCAAALMAIGRATEAVQVVQQALKLDPTDADAKFLLAKSLAAVAAGQGQVTLQAVSPPRMMQGLPLDVFPAGLGPASRHLFRPSSDGINSNLLIMLHGLGDTPRPYAALAQRMALPQTATLALSGPLEVPETEGGRAWFQAFGDDGELLQPSLENDRRSCSFAKTVMLLCKLIHQLVGCGWRHRCIHLLGFSQGGTAALELHWQLRGEARLGGCVSIAGDMLEELQWQRPRQLDTLDAKQECGPVLITWGSQDRTVSKASVDRTLQLFEQSGAHAHCRLHAVPGKGHGMIDSEAEMRAVMAFWSETLTARPPGEDVVEVCSGG